MQLSLFQKSCSSNLLVDKIKSVAALRILDLSVGLSDVFPKSKLQLKLPKVLSRMHLSLTNWGQWRRNFSVDSTSFPQLHSGFNVSWKPSLNSCSLKWLKPNLSLVIRQVPLGYDKYKQSLEMVVWALEYCFKNPQNSQIF